MENYMPRPSRPAISPEAKTIRQQPLKPPDHIAGATSVKKKRPTKRWVWIVIGAIIALLAVGGAWYFLRNLALSAGIDKSRYQAVFLTSGQVYFGKLHALDPNYMKLTDVFYIQSSTAATDGEDPQAASDGKDMQLIKLGSEVHGPEDAMIINRDQISFFENLKDDGKVVQTIKQNQNQ